MYFCVLGLSLLDSWSPLWLPSWQVCWRVTQACAGPLRSSLGQCSHWRRWAQSSCSTAQLAPTTKCTSTKRTGINHNNTQRWKQHNKHQNGQVSTTNQGVKDKKKYLTTKWTGINHKKTLVKNKKYALTIGQVSTLNKKKHLMLDVHICEKINVKVLKKINLQCVNDLCTCFYTGINGSLFCKVCKVSGADSQGDWDSSQWTADSVSQQGDQWGHRHDSRDPELAQKCAAWSALPVPEGEAGPTKTQPARNT